MPTFSLLQTCFSRSWGGLEMQALAFSRQLHRRGHEVSLAVPAESRLHAEARQAGVPVFPLAGSGIFRPLSTLGLARYLRTQKFQLIHSHLSHDLGVLVPALAIARSRAPLVLSKRMGSGIVKRDIFHRYTYARVDRVLAISSVIRANVLATTPVPAHKVEVLLDAVDLNQFAPEKAHRDRVRKEWGVEEKTIVIGCVGRFTPGKGHEELLQAARILRDRGVGFLLIVAGEASQGEETYGASIHALARTLRLEDVVRFVGFRSDVPDVMAAIDILAFPSHAESFGLVLIEAMAMGKPVVSTNCDGVLDIVVDGETGVYVHPRQPEELSAALERLVKDEGLRKSMGTAGRTRVEQLFSQEKQMARLEAMYAAIIGVRL